MPKELLRAKITVDTKNAEKSLNRIRQNTDLFAKDLKSLRRGIGHIVNELKKNNKNFDMLNKTLKRTSTSFGRLGTKTDRSKTKLKEMRLVTGGLQHSFGTLRNKILLVKYALTAVGVYAAGRFVKSTIEAASSMENWALSFEVMLGSAKRAKQMLQDLSDFEKKTTLTLPEIVENSRKLMGMGVEIENLIPIMKKLGDVSFGLGIPLDRLVLNLGQVKAQGKLTGRELRDFAIAGVPLLSELSKTLGYTEDAISDMISAGDIGYSDVIGAFESMTSAGGKFNNLMQRATTTYSGQLSLLKSEIFKLKSAIGEDLLPVVNEVIASVRPMIRELTEEIDLDDLADDLTELSKSMIKLSKTAIDNRHWLDEIIAGLLILTGIMKYPVIKSGIINLAKDIFKLGSRATRAAAKIGRFVNKFKKLSSVFAMWAIPVKAGLDDLEVYNEYLKDFTLGVEIAGASYEEFMKATGESAPHFDWQNLPDIKAEIGEITDTVGDVEIAIDIEHSEFQKYLDGQKEQIKNQKNIEKWNNELIRSYEEVANAMGLTFTGWLMKQNEILKKNNKITDYQQKMIDYSKMTADEFERLDIPLSQERIKEIVEYMKLLKDETQTFGDYLSDALEKQEKSNVIEQYKQDIIELSELIGSKEFEPMAFYLGIENIDVEALKQLADSFKGTEESARTIVSWIQEQNNKISEQLELEDYRNQFMEDYKLALENGVSSLERMGEKYGLSIEQIKRLADEFNNVEQKVQKLGNIISQTLSAGMRDGMDGILDYWDSLLKQMMADLVVSGILNILTGGTAGGFGMFGSGGLFGGMFSNGGTISNVGGTPVVKAASGLENFTVPSGYPNDSFPIMVESGETVNVTPSNQSGRTEELLEKLIETINNKPIANTIVFDDVEMSRYVERGNIKRMRVGI